MQIQTLGFRDDSLFLFSWLPYIASLFIPIYFSFPISTSSRQKSKLMLFFLCVPASLLLQELIPLILCTACLHPEPKERDQLLHILFNLIKRPDDDQRWRNNNSLFCLISLEHHYSFPTSVFSSMPCVCVCLSKDKWSWQGASPSRST